MFGERLKALREQAGLTQEKLARAADVSLMTVSRLERKGLDPNWSTVVALARALGVSVAVFDNGDAPVPKKETGKGKKGGAR
jgi:transcriptional regulator with XRE-family HTH domain